jgi:hypothetical protein
MTGTNVSEGKPHVRTLKCRRRIAAQKRKLVLLSQLILQSLQVDRTEWIPFGPSDDYLYKVSPRKNLDAYVIPPAFLQMSSITRYSMSTSCF